MMARVTDNGTISEAFALTNGVKHGCILVPTLFSLMFSDMLTDAYREERSGIRVTYRWDSRLFNQRQMHFRSRVSTAHINVNGTQLKSADTFTYLSSNLSRSTKIDD
ncbi:unnamed protein product [Schistocephalus solidus]|uniref:Reverse transcriptase domain-containing protein n=1 Tax=Schistocephalus solidus TaxID=70667 RepID=A0A183T7R8_SCHSO|nr:unnamed protein product [Schistocephalus solidus]